MSKGASSSLKGISLTLLSLLFCVAKRDWIVYEESTFMKLFKRNQQCIMLLY